MTLQRKVFIAALLFLLGSVLGAPDHDLEAELVDAIMRITPFSNFFLNLLRITVISKHFGPDGRIKLRPTAYGGIIKSVDQHLLPELTREEAMQMLRMLPERHRRMILILDEYFAGGIPRDPYVIAYSRKDLTNHVIRGFLKRKRLLSSESLPIATLELLIREYKKMESTEKRRRNDQTCFALIDTSDYLALDSVFSASLTEAGSARILVEILSAPDTAAIAEYIDHLAIPKSTWISILESLQSELHFDGIDLIEHHRIVFNTLQLLASVARVPATLQAMSDTIRERPEQIYDVLDLIVKIREILPRSCDFVFFPFFAEACLRMENNKNLRKLCDKIFPHLSDWKKPTADQEEWLRWTFFLLYKHLPSLLQKQKPLSWIMRVLEYLVHKMPSASFASHFQVKSTRTPLQSQGNADTFMAHVLAPPLTQMKPYLSLLVTLIKCVIDRMPTKLSIMGEGDHAVINKKLAEIVEEMSSYTSVLSNDMDSIEFYLKRRSKRSCRETAAEIRAEVVRYRSLANRSG